MGDHIEPVSKAHPLGYLKSIGSGIATGAFVLSGFVSGDETLFEVTTNEWLWVVIGVLGSAGITYIIPNKKTVL